MAKEIIDVSIVIVNFNTKKLTLECIDSVIKNTKNINYEIILVDNASIEGPLPSKKYRLIKSENNLGFAGGNNLGMHAAKGRFVLLLNSDTIIETNAVADMVNFLDKNKKIGIASCKLKNLDGTTQATGGYSPNLLNVFSWMTIQDFPLVDDFIKPFHPKPAFYNNEKSLDWVTGAFMMIRREVINKIGYLDEDYFMYGEDDDFCFRARQAGWEIKYVPQISIIHLGGKSSTKSFPILSEITGIKIFFKKHRPKWQYPWLRLFLKVGALGRIVVLGLFKDKSYVQIYIKAVQLA